MKTVTKRAGAVQCVPIMYDKQLDLVNRSGQNVHKGMHGIGLEKCVVCLVKFIYGHLGCTNV